MPAIHLIQKDPNLRPWPLEKGGAVYESGYWVVSEETAAGLVGGDTSSSTQSGMKVCSSDARACRTVCRDEELAECDLWLWAEASDATKGNTANLGVPEHEESTANVFLAGSHLYYLHFRLRSCAGQVENSGR